MGPEQGEEGRGALPRASAVGGAGRLASHPARAPRLLVLPCPGCLGQQPLAQSPGAFQPAWAAQAPTPWGAAPSSGRAERVGQEACKWGPQWLCSRSSFLGPQAVAQILMLKMRPQEAFRGRCSGLTHSLQAPLCPPGPPTAACPSIPHLTPNSGDLVLRLGHPDPSPDST